MSFIQTDTYALRGYECDANGLLSIPALMNFMQESANRNVIDYGIGINDLAQRGYGWMLMRFGLRMHQYPHYGQHIRVITYPTFVEKYFIHRDFRVLADDDTLLADARSTWLVFSTEKRSMVPMPDFIRTLTPPADVDSLPKLTLKPDFQAIPVVSTETQSVTVGWFDIDQNQHVNNVSYVQWLLEAMPKEMLQTSELAELDVIFRNESHWPDQLLIRADADDALTFRHRIEQAETSKDVILARSRWR
ncbi:acyl-[acyl-carrier-protein] thioesterase [Spirosoma montaniterrae]|uniref:Acyl-ACP thioesterase n=1 Tax=Spirosoma montaniterrae TaxID=1178516 RepID=A0A1P9WZ86_9BACT|nr:acyl-ACP thioesterase domain-containing protein [Spirosoma montaniterrae]AQG80689.1 acyl-ACP thioesterase [Spirosoma montaniterrae]